jgi:hypothetical protein
VKPLVQVVIQSILKQHLRLHVHEGREKKTKLAICAVANRGPRLAEFAARGLAAHRAAMQDVSNGHPVRSAVLHWQAFAPPPHAPHATAALCLPVSAKS